MFRLASLVLALFVASVASASSPSNVEQPLLVKNKQTGQIECGLLASFVLQKDGVLVQLPESLDKQAVLSLLVKAHADWKVTSAKSALLLSGLGNAEIQNRLLAIKIAPDQVPAGGGDALSDLAMMEDTAIAMGVPESSGSIRAAKPMDVLTTEESAKEEKADSAGGEVLIEDHDPKERWVGQVLRVNQEEFPAVILKLRVRAAPSKGPHKTRFRRGTVLDVRVLYASQSGAIDFNNEATQRNLLAYYLSPGDRIALHAIVSADDEIQADWLQRKRVARSRKK